MPVLCWYFHHRWERGRKGREYKFQNKAHRTFDPRNALSPVVFELGTEEMQNSIRTPPRICAKFPLNHENKEKGARAIFSLTDEQSAKFNDCTRQSKERTDSL